MLIALLVWQGGVELITRIARSVYWRLSTHSSVLASSQSSFPWENVVFSVVSGALYLLTAYGLVRWLYGKDIWPSQEQPAEQPFARR